MTSTRPGDGEFRNGMPFFGGSLWIDLINTTPVRDGQALDLIATPEGFAAWLEGAGIAPRERNVSQSVAAALALREALRPAFAVLQQGGALPQNLLDYVNSQLASITLHYQLVQDAAGIRLEACLGAGGQAPLSRIIEDFARFSADHAPERLKRCGNNACKMVFYDTSKNGKRRWCSMSLCGNRHKVSQYRARREG